MSPEARSLDQRATYFVFQGLLMSVLVLLFVYQYRTAEGWGWRLALLAGLLGGSLVLLRTAPQRLLGRAWFQTAFFLGDAALASLTLHWTRPQSDLYLIYVLIIFGTALTRDLARSLLVALVTSLLYLGSAWSPLRGFPHDTGFWLRFLFLWITASLLAILSRDSERAQAQERAQIQERLISAERLATLGRIAGEVAHRIKGPLTTIMVNADVLSHGAKSKASLKQLREIRREAGRCKEILKGLLDLGRIEEMDLSPVDLREPVRLALQSVEPQMRRLRLRRQVAVLPRPLLVRGDQSLLQEAVFAVLQNAVEAVGPGGRVRVDVREEGGAYAVAVEDDGCGIAAGELEKVFQPFFTTKGRDGSGLGLSAALRIMQKHRGSIVAFSEGPRRGARFVLTIPASPS